MGLGHVKFERDACEKSAWKNPLDILSDIHKFGAQRKDLSWR